MKHADDITKGYNDVPAEFTENANRLVKLAEDALERVLRNKKAPASAVVSAANSVLDRAERAAERHRDPMEREVGDLTLAELDAIVRRLELQRSAQSAQDAQIIGPAPDNPS